MNWFVWYQDTKQSLAEIGLVVMNLNLVVVRILKVSPLPRFTLVGSQRQQVDALVCRNAGRTWTEERHER